jgi:hypothetical protein
MAQGWKKIQATLLARARAKKKAVEEARNASTMDKGRDLPSSELSTTTASPLAPSAPSAPPAIPALSTPSTSRSRTGGTDPVSLLAAHGCHGRHGTDAVVQAPVSNIIRKPWLKKMPDIGAKKEAKRARAASCPLSCSPPEGKISDDTSESFSSGTDSGSDSNSDSSSSNNSSNITVIEKKGETKSKPDGIGSNDDGDGDVLLLNDPSLQSFQFVDKERGGGLQG